MIVIDLMATTKSDKKFPSPGLTPKCWQKKALTLVCDEIQQRSVLDNKAALSPRRSYSSKPCRTGDYIALKPRDHAEKKALSSWQYCSAQSWTLGNTAALSPGQSCSAQSQEIMLAQGVKWTKSSVLRISFMQWNFHWSRSLRKYEKMLTGNGYFFIHLLTSRPTSSDPPKTLANLIRLHVTSCTGM